MAYEFTIDGEAVPGADVISVVNPATEEIFAEAPRASRNDLEKAIAAARQSYPSWAERTGRREKLLECSKRLKSQAIRLAKLLTQEQGKPYREALEEILGSVRALRYWAGRQLPEEYLQTRDGFRISIQRKPLGVVAAITPWNYPVILAIWKIAPALLAGNTIILKPSPFTPLTTLEIGALFREVLPRGVLNVLSGEDDIGKALASHPAVRKVSVTGSIATGKSVARAAADDLKRVTLELGGNDAAIVLDDVDPVRIAREIFWGTFKNCGQICLAIKRLYAQERIYSALVQELKQLAASARIGNGLDPQTEIGPLNNEIQFNRIISLVEDARQRGGEVLAGGHRRNGAGYFFEPTIICGLDEDAPLVQEEQFGPALPVMRFGDIDDAVSKANATTFGLGGSVWSADLDRGRDIAARLECGTVWLNQHGVTYPDVPIGGMKWSGIGYENGLAGLDGFTTIQTMYLPHGT